MKLFLLAAFALVCAGVLVFVRTGAGARHAAQAGEPLSNGRPPVGADLARDETVETLPEAVRAELEAARARIAQLEDQVQSLRASLDMSEESRVAREREFLHFTQGIAQLGRLSGVSLPPFEARVPAGEGAPSPDPAGAIATADSPLRPDPGGARSRALFLGLRGLLAAEQVQGLDLLEAGNLLDGAIGPVVFRVLDDRGRPLGSISAERLRLEASRAARMVTIVLEQGWESRDGVRTPFSGGPADAEGRGGQRRIVLPDCDPRAWMEGLPELFPLQDKDEQIDDGRFDLGRLRATLNTLLRAESGASLEAGGATPGAGRYRLQGIGGVQGIVLRDVALDQLDRVGGIERRFFADRMVILREAQGLQILLEAGSQVRGEQKTPFLEGRYRIFLPRARVEAWEKAGVPGLAGDGPATIAPAEPKTEPRKP